MSRVFSSSKRSVCITFFLSLVGEGGGSGTLCFEENKLPYLLLIGMSLPITCLTDFFFSFAGRKNFLWATDSTGNV